MRNLLWCAMSVCAIAASSAVQAEQLPELLSPVDQQTVARLERKTNFTLRAQLYPAKRYRFVNIDFSLLDVEGARFTITPFDDLSIRVTTKVTRAPGSTEESRQWMGQSVDPDAYTMDGSPLSIDVGLFIGKAQETSQVDRIIGPAAASADNAASDVPPASSSPYGLRATDESKASVRPATLSGDLFVYSRAAHIFIQPVESDPHLHVVFEEDPEKVVSGAHATPDGPAKFRRHEKFMEELERERKEAIGREVQQAPDLSLRPLPAGMD